MKPKTIFYLVAALVATVLLASCQSTQFADTLSKLVEDKVITPEQATAIGQTYTQFNSGDAWWQTALTIVGAAGLSLLGVRSNIPIFGRGAPTQKVGLPASMIVEAK